MKKKRIGFFLNIDRNCGGMYQACLNILYTIYDLYKENNMYEFVVFAKTGNKELVKEFNAPDWEIVFLPESKITMGSRFKKIIKFGILRDLLRWIKSLFIKVNLNTRIINPKLNEFLKSFSLNCIFFPNFDEEAYQQEVPFLTFIPDIQHLLQPNFPEVGDKYSWMEREKHVRNLVRHASMLIVDSQISKEDLAYCYSEYGVNSKPVLILKYMLSQNITDQISPEVIKEVRQKYNLPERFFFYPAQFWSHKNHKRIVEAISLLEKRFSISMNIVFCGSNTGKYREKCYKELKRYVIDKNLTDSVYFLQYISDLELSVLYHEAVALVMPTFFGPANIPIVEAWAMNCPVIYSDIRGLREQAGNAALLVDPCSAPNLAEAMKLLWESEEYRNKLVESGKKRLNEYSKEEYYKNLKAIIEKAGEII
jgi:glycosyltransferase involved in cell wall biosynthesis